MACQLSTGQPSLSNVLVSMDRDDATRYEQAGVDVQESLSGWAKQQEAALAEDQDPSLWDSKAQLRSRDLLSWQEAQILLS